jgi:hypothetical protein
MRHALMLAAVLASAARAGNVVYEHPALKVRLTVHTVEGAAAPDAISYEGPEGFYLIKASELSSFEHGDGYSTFRYDVVELRADGFLKQEVSYVDAKPFRFADDACVAAVENTIGSLIGRGKLEAPDEYVARTVTLRRRAQQARSTWRSYEIEAESGSTMILDKAALDAVAKPLADAVAAVEDSRSQRLAREYLANVAAPTAADPNPKADFYVNQSRALDTASAALSRVDGVLASARLPSY